MTQQAKPMPGPWAYEKEPIGTFQVYGTGEAIDDCVANNIVNEADARLIAAAPELLVALKDALIDLEALAVPKSWPALDKRIATCRAAIAKAQGR